MMSRRRKTNPKPSARITGALIATLCLTAAWPLRADQVDDYVKRQMERHHIPGLSLAVVKDGTITKAKGYGLADVELNAPATRDTIYEIGSLTKLFTATAVMMLANEGKIGLQDHITNYVSGLPPSWNGITVRHLLSHTSGITKDYAGVSPNEYRSPYSPKRLLESAANWPLSYKPG